MRKVIRAFFIWIALGFFTYLIAGNSPSLSLLALIPLFGFIYFLATLIRYLVGLRSTHTAQQFVASQGEVPARKSNRAVLWIVLLLVITIIFLVFSKPLGMYSFRTFVFMDSLLAMNRQAVVGWALLGLFVGFAYGSVTAWKKYRLNLPVALISPGLLLLLVAILFLVNKPLSSQSFSSLVRTKKQIAYNLVSVTDKSSDASRNLYSYASYLTDNSTYTAWITDIKKKDAGKEIEFTFSYLGSITGKNPQCSGLELQNGNRKSDDLWNAYGRIKNFSVWKNGTLLTSGTADDSNQGTQEISFTPVAIAPYDKISVKFNSVTPGSRYPKKAAVTELIPVIQYEESY